MRRGNVCGACAGALMVLGLMYGETHAGDREGRLRTDRLNDLMMDRFSRANGSCLCNQSISLSRRTAWKSLRSRIRICGSAPISAAIKRFRKADMCSASTRALLVM